MTTEQLSKLIKAVIDNYANTEIKDGDLESVISKMYNHSLTDIDYALKVDEKLYVEFNNYVNGDKYIYIELKPNQPIVIEDTNVDKGCIMIRYEVKE